MRLKTVVVIAMLLGFLVVIWASGRILKKEIEVVDTEAQMIDALIRNLEPGEDYVPGQVIVKYKKSSVDLRSSRGRTKVSDLSKQYEVARVDELQDENIQLLEVGEDTGTVMKKLVKDPVVETVQLNYIYKTTAINTNDPLRGDLWGLDNTGQGVNDTARGKVDADIDAPEAWAINEGTNSQVLVAVVDTGVDYLHPDLAANMWDGSSCKDHEGKALGGCVHGYDFHDYDKTPLPASDAHGTHVAGTISAVKNNGKGLVGVAPNAKIMAIRTSLLTIDSIKAINFAKHNGAKVINASWGGRNNDSLLSEAIGNFPGLFVASAGNSAYNHSEANKNLYPCDYSHANIICVAATDQNDSLAKFSDYGMEAVDIAAPGVDIQSTYSRFEESTEDFETIPVGTVPNGWTKSGSNNKWAVKTNPVWGNMLYAHYNGIPYDNNADTSLTTERIDMATRSAGLGFRVMCDTQLPSLNGERDYLQIQYSKDGINFVNAKDLADHTKPLKISEYYLGYPLPSGGLVSDLFMNVPLTIPEEFLNSTFQLRFNWVTDGSDNAYEGCAVDKISFYKYKQGEVYKYSPGTSMAAPHVSGVAALLWGYKPGLTVTQVKSIIMETGDSLPSLSGKTVSGKRLNAHQAMVKAQEMTVATNTPTPRPTATPTTVPTSRPSITASARPSVTVSSSSRPSAVASVTVPVGTDPEDGIICGPGDVDGDGAFTMPDFLEFARSYNKSCTDTGTDYGVCGGKDLNQDGVIDIIDFGAFEIGFAQRYFPKTSCALP